jgi:hypothetical protein
VVSKLISAKMETFGRIEKVCGRTAGIRTNPENKAMIGETNGGVNQ